MLDEQSFYQMLFNMQNRKGRRDILFRNKNRLMTKKGYRSGRRLKVSRKK